MGFIFSVCILLFALVTYPLATIFTHYLGSEFFAFAAAIVINLLFSTILFLLYIIKDYLSVLVKRETD